MSLPILAEVFSLLNCPDKKCRGRVHLYEHIMQDGLQKFLLIKFRICHLLVAEFPASLPNGIPADACVNNKSVRVRGQSELNIRSLIAVHSTSQSWEEFRLSCSVLDVNVPTATMSRTHMIRFVQATRNVVCASIKASGQIVHSVLPSEPSLPITLRNCTVSFDASWHRRGHFSNQGFAAVIESESGKVWTISCMTGSAFPAQAGQRKGKRVVLMCMQSFGTVTKRYVTPTFQDRLRVWRAQLLSKFGSVRLRHTV